MTYVRTARDVARTPSGIADPTIREIVHQRLECLSSRLGDPNSVRSLVYDLIVQGLPERNSSARDIATALSMSERTLRRRLADEGTSHRQVLEEGRRQLAIFGSWESSACRWTRSLTTSGTRSPRAFSGRSSGGRGCPPRRSGRVVGGRPRIHPPPTEPKR